MLVLYASGSHVSRIAPLACGGNENGAFGRERGGGGVNTFVVGQYVRPKSVLSAVQPCQGTRSK